MKILNRKEMKKFKIISHHQTVLFKILEKFIPYTYLLFGKKTIKTLRKVVKLKWFFKYFHLRRVERLLTKTLNKTKANYIDFAKYYDVVSKTIGENDIYWEVIQNK